MLRETAELILSTWRDDGRFKLSQGWRDLPSMEFFIIDKHPAGPVPRLLVEVAAVAIIPTSVYRCDRRQHFQHMPQLPAAGIHLRRFRR